MILVDIVRLFNGLGDKKMEVKEKGNILQRKERGESLGILAHQVTNPSSVSYLLMTSRDEWIGGFLYNNLLCLERIFEKFEEI